MREGGGCVMCVVFKANIWNKAIIYAQLSNCMGHDLEALYKLLGLILIRE